MRFPAKALATTTIMILACTGSAYASTAAPDPGEVSVKGGCTWELFCGALVNGTHQPVYVAWSDDESGYKYAWVAPGAKKGGRWHDGIDIDFFYVAEGCKAADLWENEYNPGWQKINDLQTVLLTSYTC
ncbi:hypothetical protein AB0E55_26705 [Amycolatopsis keratiniphila]|uniref:Peptidase inhibitor family I36 n=1 Tax=Amycolatopsis keratiniphila TaxID=129921 RepID=R4SR60_9PSEU|nr:hypothetical protein [Amycolatopsis keratiniphila]AGM05909.1 hypothetical protein AORI_3324 [Amycolatopsis keratiniphila]